MLLCELESSESIQSPFLCIATKKPTGHCFGDQVSPKQEDQQLSVACNWASLVFLSRLSSDGKNKVKPCELADEILHLLFQHLANLLSV